MKICPQLFLAMFGLGLLPLSPSAIAADQPRTVDESRARDVVSFDDDWRFFKGEAESAEQSAFDDAGWRALSVPHDWSIEGPFDEKAPTRGDGGFLPSGVSWYRKHFALPEARDDRRVFIEFGGVMANSEVWLNGHSLGKRPFGYVSFRYELTPYLQPGRNVLAVRADTSAQPAARWYTGAGIYRHVRLITTGAVRFDHWGVFVSTPEVRDTEAAVKVQARVVNSGEAERAVSLRIRILDPEGRTVATAEGVARTLAAGATDDFVENVVVKAPQRWDLETPRLYRAVVDVRSAGGTLDDEAVSFGIREFHFEAATGFWLNGRNFKIKGVCLHEDGGAFGAAIPLRVWEDRLEALRALGVNAVRTAHNPFSPAFLALCDRMGFLVMDEVLDAWTVAKRPYDYHLYFADWGLIDTRDTVRRDRNHPSIILYSAGNEIHDTRKPESAKLTLASLIEVYHREDPTRPVTQAIFRPNATGDYKNGFADMLDVVGQNYREREILDAHRQNPARKIIGTENNHLSTAWVALRDHAPYAGQFIWTGIDYLGESRRWPLIATDFGLLLRTGLPRPRGYERMSWWSDTPMVRIARSLSERAAPVADPGYETAAQMQVQAQQQKEPELLSDWTPQNGSAHEEIVEVFSNCDDVELFLNERSLGSLPKPENARPRMWKVGYEPGTIRAVGKNGGQVAAVHELRTAGAPAKLVLTAKRTRIADNWDDVIMVDAQVADANGERAPSATMPVEFSISGPGVIAAVDNGDNASHEPFQAARRTTFDGRCQAFVKATASTGRIVLSASASGLEGASIEFEATR